MAHTNVGPLSAGSHGSFPQAGSWSMVDIAKLPVQATVGILSRYAAGRVNPYTVLVCDALCGNFKLSANGRANIETAVAKLTAVSAIGATLEFGFGIDDLIRSMTKSEQGTITLALCAALMEVYSLDIGTEVLLELARLTGVGGEWMPSSREWKALLNACSGILAPTTFGIRAEVLMQMSNENQRLGAFQKSEALPRDVRNCSSPKSIAEALLAISAITRKEMQAVTLIGGPDTGWLATVAELLLDLRISLSSSQGETLYTNTKDLGTVQVSFIFQGQTPVTSQAVSVQGRTYVLREISEILGGEATSSMATTVSGRVEWKRALRSAFLLDFQNLLEAIPETFGTLLGCAGRMFKAIAEADTSIPLLYLTACTTYCDQSFGAGFVNNTLSWFPELERIRVHMEKAVVLPLKAARRDYEASIARLRQYCSCRACQTPSNGFNLDIDIEMTPAGSPPSGEPGAPEGENEDQESAPSDVTENFEDWDADKYCAVILTETIIVLSRSLGNVSLSGPEIKPMRSGFELAYGRQLTMRRSARSGMQAIQDLGQFAFCMDFDANFSFGMRDNDYGTGLRLDLVLELFSGERPRLSNNGVSAACSKGLCAYFDILKDFSFNKGRVGAISIIPGRIQYDKKSYTTLEDRYIIQDDDFDTTIQNLFRDGADFTTLALSVKESSTALECLMQLPRLSTDLETVVAGPANLSDLIAARRGLVPCRQGRTRRAQCRRVDGLTAEERHRLTTEGGRVDRDWLKLNSIYIFHCKDPLVSRVVVSHCAAQYDYRSSIFFVDRECLDCCLRMAIRMEQKSELYFFYLIES